MIHQSTASKLNVKLITNMNIENVFDILVDVVFYISPKIGGIGPKSQDLVIPFCFKYG